MIKFDPRKQSLQQRIKRVAVRMACFLMVSAAVFGGAGITAGMPSALAVGSEAAGEVVNERAAAELDRMAGAGTSDKLSGVVDETVGKAKRGVADIKDTLDIDTTGAKLEGAADELKGKAKRGAAKVGDALDADTLGTKIDGATDELAGKAKQTGAKIGDALSADTSVTDKMDGATDELAGKAKRGLGEAKSTAADIGDDVEDSAGGFLQSVKDFFN